MSEIEWAEPPTNGRSDWSTIAEQLRSNAGRWAKVKSNTSSGTTAMQIKGGVLKDFRPAGAFEAKAVSIGGKKFDIYARFVGEDGAR